MKTATWMVILGGSLVAAGCGQKGPLYLPDKNASVVTRPAGTTNTAPATTTPPGAAPDQTSPQQTPQATPPKQPQDKTSDSAQSSSSTPKN